MLFNASPRRPAAENKYTPSRANPVFSRIFACHGASHRGLDGIAHVHKVVHPDLWLMNRISSILKCSYIPQS